MKIQNIGYDDARFRAFDPDLPAGEVCLANDSLFVQSQFREGLTDFAVAWRDTENIGATLDHLAPPLEVSRRFTYKSWSNLEAFLSDATNDDLRAIGTDFKEVNYTGSETDGSTDNRGLTIRLDIDGPGQSEAYQRAVTGMLMQRLDRNELRRTWTRASAAAVNTAKTWDTTAGKDPDQDIRTELITATDLSGLRPNRVLYGETAWDKRGVSYGAQNTAAGNASYNRTPEELARLLRVQRVHIDGARYQSTASAKSQITGNKVLMLYGEDSPLQMDPSNFKMFWTRTRMGTPVAVYVREEGVKFLRITVERYRKSILTSTLGIRQFTVN